MYMGYTSVIQYLTQNASVVCLEVKHYPCSIPAGSCIYTADVSCLYATLILLRATCTHLFMQEGPHSALNEEEFFDALEMAYQNDEMEGNVSS